MRPTSSPNYMRPFNGASFSALMVYQYGVRVGMVHVVTLNGSVGRHVSLGVIWGCVDHKLSHFGPFFLATQVSGNSVVENI